MSHVAVVLPGGGYGPAGPVLLIPALALEQRGATVVRVAYPDWRPREVDATTAGFNRLAQAVLDFDAA